MLAALGSFSKNFNQWGMYINSCFAHCQSESQDTWLAVDSPRIHDVVQFFTAVLKMPFLVISFSLFTAD